jgi:hypothetical protein
LKKLEKQMDKKLKIKTELVKKLKQETSSTGTGASVTPGDGFGQYVISAPGGNTGPNVVSYTLSSDEAKEGNTGYVLVCDAA